MTGWLEAATDPGSLRRGGHAGGTPPAGLALLVDGRLGEYRRTAATAGWPALTEAEPPAAVEQRLLWGLGTQLLGGRSVDALFIEIFSDRTASTELRIIAAILADISLADASGHRASIDVLRSALAIAPSGPLRRLVLVHLATRLLEVADREDAFSTIERAVSEPIEAPRAVDRRIRAVARRDRLPIAFAARRMDAVKAAAKTTPEIGIQAAYLRGLDGLEAYVSSQFAALTEDPNSQSMTFNIDDPIEAPLMGSLLRSELLGDISATREARERLGLVRFLRSLGDVRRQPEPAIHLLRRAGKVDLLRAALRTFRHQGPLAPLRNVGHTVITFDWVDAERIADLVILAEAADSLTDDAASAALTRILDDLDGLLLPTSTSRAEAAIAAALAALTPSAPSDLAERASRRARDLADADPSDGLLLQELARFVGALSPELVGDEEAAEWAAWAARFVNVRDHRRFVAHAAIQGPATQASPRSIGALTAAFLADESVDTGAILLGQAERASTSIPRPAVTLLTRLLIQQLDSVRADAAVGKFGFGEYIDAPRLLASLLTTKPRRAGWNALAAFLVDPSIPPSKKSGALDQLAGKPEPVPANTARRIVRGTRVVDQPALPFEVPEELIGAALRFAIATGEATEADAVARFSILAGSIGRRGRLEAAHTVRWLLRVWQSQSAVSTGLVLARDAAFEVRGEAARSLAAELASIPAPFHRAVEERLLAIGQEPGGLVPQYVLAGLREHMSRGHELPLPLRTFAASTARNSISRRVRFLAAQLL